MKKYLLVFGLGLSFLNGVSAAENNSSDIPLKLQDSRETEISELSAHQLKRRFYPFTDSQISEFKHREEERVRFLNESIRDPEIQQRTIGVKLSVKNEEVNLFSSVNFQTNLVFVDRQGEPWPIEKIGVGAKNFFTVDHYLPHAVQISPLKKYKKTNLSVLLKGESLPLVFTVKEDKDIVDYLVQIKVAGIASSLGKGGYARVAQSRGQDQVAVGVSSEIMDMSDGVTPSSAIPLDVVKGGEVLMDVLAWSYGGSGYLRIQGELLVPSGDLIAVGIDQYNLFKLPIVQTVMIERDGVVLSDIQLIGK